jgi:PIN domain nuclease of toxin-antitoxin system
MTKTVLDASALLAMLNSKPGADTVAEYLPDARISAVNLSEVIAKLNGAGVPEKVIYQILEPLDLKIEAFDRDQAYQSGLMRTLTKKIGLSLGDRACLSLGIKLGAVVLTADKTWAALSPTINIRVIR